jgi:hypothetical protein
LRASENLIIAIMARSNLLPPVEQLQRAEPLQQVLAREKPEDCLPCRIVGENAEIISAVLFTNKT